tara:strand:+ start:273 stop:467 length:195 start_codon:yes stop_codon:yes gene_type:complete
LKTDRGSYEFVDVDGERRVLAIGFLGKAGGLTVKVKEGSPQKPQPGILEPHLPLEDTEHPRMAA